jgi:hypothetical protein
MQKDENDERTPEEVKSFGKAIETMGIVRRPSLRQPAHPAFRISAELSRDPSRVDPSQWYAHRLLTTFIMSELPEGWPKTEEARPFFPVNWLRGKGWPSFERAVSGLIKPASAHSWRRIVDPAVPRSLGQDGYRAAPLPPKLFAAELALKVFTNGADCEMVAGLYADTLAGAIGNAKLLEFTHLEWKDEDAARLAAVLPMATRLEKLIVKNDLIGQRGYDALAEAIRDGAAPELKEMDLGFHRVLGRVIRRASTDSLYAACTARGVHVIVEEWY